MIWDETAAQDLHKAAFNTMRSKTSDFGSGCSADGNIVIQDGIWDAALNELVAVGGHMLSEAEQEAVKKVMWDEGLHKLPDTVALAPQAMAKAAGFSIADDRKFLIASMAPASTTPRPRGSGAARS